MNLKHLIVYLIVLLGLSGCVYDPTMSQQRPAAPAAGDPALDDEEDEDGVG